MIPASVARRLTLERGRSKDARREPGHPLRQTQRHHRRRPEVVPFLDLVVLSFLVCESERKARQRRQAAAG